MPPPFPFEAVLLFGFLSILLLSGVLLRAWLGFLQRLLFPASLIGGLLGFALINGHGFGFDTELIKAFAYHFFNISFISVGLTPPAFQDHGAGRQGMMLRGSIWMAVLQAATFSLQALVGGVLVVLFMLLGMPLFETFGFLVPLAFNEGPGQALSIGRAWEAVGFVDASTIGLTFATIGFFFAFFVGVPMANLAVRRKRFVNTRPDPFFLKGILPRGQASESGAGLTTHSANVDCLAFHLAQIGLAYVVTWFLVSGLTWLVPGEASAILWGFFFLFGLVVAIGLRKALEAASLGRLLDAPLQRRITGMSVDYLIVATGCGIDLIVVGRYGVPIAVMALAAGVLTTLMVVMLGRRLSDYSLERTLAMYGVVTGTVASGLLLLRIVDPEFETPVAREIGFMNIFTVPIVGGLTFLLNVPLWWGWGLGATCAVLSAVCVMSCVILSRRRLWSASREASL